MEREALLLRFFDELTINEISRTLNRGKSAIKTHPYHALGKVRDRAECFDLEMAVSDGKKKIGSPQQRSVAPGGGGRKRTAPKPA
jgi:hypothetical protein